MKENMEADPIILHNWKYGHSKLNLNSITFPFYKTKDHILKEPHHTEQKNSPLLHIWGQKCLFTFYTTIFSNSQENGLLKNS